ncbi:hypothetical protein [Neoroseomonas soli]|uniref:Uncharacterized protein n=1 Tax=Neoroseomonas soli TaxID=1081025 RepID=A0A9X9WUY7_9PROT|nr:hypothetical protein [Neoroseomonas soli]MBR0670966.1 hypothetical protein [Neoroseomonas soli]
MILRTIALLFFGLAVALGFALGWGYELGTAMYKVNPAALNSLQVGVQRYLAPVIWDGLFVPFLTMPVWLLPTLFGLGFMIASSMRPGRG